MNEIKFLKCLQDHGIGETLEVSTNEYEEFDASDGKCIVEFKYRNSDYDEYMIEATKIFSNYHYAQKVNKKFFYVVITPTLIIVWDMAKYLNEFNNGNVTFNNVYLPTNQHRGEKRNIKKFVNFIPVSWAVKIIRL